MTGIRHLVQCRCVLPMYRDSVDPVFHKFPVFSMLDDDDVVIVKTVACDNCGVMHRVFDVCRSEVIFGHDDSPVTMTVEDIRLTLPTRLGDILMGYLLHISVWEEVQFVYQGGHWGTEIVMTRDEVMGRVQGKKLRIDGFDDFKITQFALEVDITGGVDKC